MAEDTAKTGNSFLEPERIVQGFGLKKGDHVADFGAGHGFFALAFARAVGREGKVWAVDIQRSALDMVRSRAMAEHLLNMEYVRADLESPGSSGLPERFMDFVFVGNILFQAERRSEILREARRILRENGKIAIIEWDVAVPMLPDVEHLVPEGQSSKSAMPPSGMATLAAGRAYSTSGNVGSGTIGPSPALRVKKSDAKALVLQAGFEVDREFAAGPHHYGLLFVKK